MNEDQEAFIEAVKSGNTAQMSQMLDQNPGLAQARTLEGVSPILLAIYHGYPEAAQLLVDRGAPLDIWEASALGRLDRVVALTEAQPAQVNAYAPDGFQPLGLASFFGHLMVVEYLLVHGADPNSPSQNDLHAAPLHSAVAHKDVGIARELLAHGADPNAREQGGYTPLLAAIQNGQADMVQLLLEYRADPHLSNASGQTPLSLAQQQNHPEIVSLLQQALG